MKETPTLFSLNLQDEAATLWVAQQFSKACGHTKALIFLEGPLGAGKTTFTRGFLSQLGYLGKVKSPTYTLVESYFVSNIQVYHFDFYRLNDPEELAFIGITEYLNEAAICLIEWPENGKGFLPEPDVIIHIEYSQDARKLSCEAKNDVGQKILSSFMRLNSQKRA